MIELHLPRHSGSGKALFVQQSPVGFCIATRKKGAHGIRQLSRNLHPVAPPRDHMHIMPQPPQMNGQIVCHHFRPADGGQKCGSEKGNFHCNQATDGAFRSQFVNQGGWELGNLP